jgi:hypothetical protein
VASKGPPFFLHFVVSIDLNLPDEYVSDVRRGETMAGSSERRDGPRIDLRLRVRYTAGEASGEAEASDISPRGLRLESFSPVEPGAELQMVADTGEEESLKATGLVTWCQKRRTPTGRTMYDIGLHFADEWLAQDRGPLGSALAKIFSMNQFEPARAFQRTQVSLRATAASEIIRKLEIVDLSVGGLQLKAIGPGHQQLAKGKTIEIDLVVAELSHVIQGKIVWTSGPELSGDGLPDEEPGEEPGEETRLFGIQFVDLGLKDRDLLEHLQATDLPPDRITFLLND